MKPPVAGAGAVAQPRETPAEPPTVQGTGRQPKAPKPVHPSLFEVFAAAHGFIADGGNRFYHPDGSWITRTHESRFPWEQHDAAGEWLQSYWVKDHCIEREPLELDAALWLLCEQFPDRHTIIFAAADGNPVAISGRRLLALRDQGALALHPATYRLVYRIL